MGLAALAVALALTLGRGDPEPPVAETDGSGAVPAAVGTGSAEAEGSAAGPGESGDDGRLEEGDADASTAGSQSDANTSQPGAETGGDGVEESSGAEEPSSPVSPPPPGDGSNDSASAAPPPEETPPAADEGGESTVEPAPPPTAAPPTTTTALPPTTTTTTTAPPPPTTTTTTTVPPTTTTTTTVPPPTTTTTTTAPPPTTTTVPPTTTTTAVPSPDWGELARSVVLVQVEGCDGFEPRQYGIGSGTVVVEGRHVLTNAHVVLSDSGRVCPDIAVWFVNEFESEPSMRIEATVVAYDDSSVESEGVSGTGDLALLRLERSTGRDPIPVVGRTLEPGEVITTLGFPGAGGGTMTLTRGVYSGSKGDFIKTDSDISSGNSGGAAFDEQGNFVGVPTAGAEPSRGTTEIGLLIPAADAERFIARHIG